jgi:DNA-binding response OmpR family regulator
MARILMVDDDQTILDLEKKLLSDEGHDVLVVENALVALDILEFYEVDLIILDIEMPRYNGFQFVTTLRNNPELANIPIAFLSAHSEAETIAKAGKLGADFYLLKPIEEKSFINKINIFLNKNVLNAHPKIEFQSPVATNVKIHLTAHIIEVTDIGVKILIEHELVEGQLIELSSDALSGVLSENPLFKVSWIKAHDDNLKEVTLLFTDQSIETVRKIQKHIQAKMEVLKYSKVS